MTEKQNFIEDLNQVMDQRFIHYHGRIIERLSENEYAVAGIKVRSLPEAEVLVDLAMGYKYIEESIERGKQL